MRAFFRSLALFAGPLIALNASLALVVDRLYFRPYLDHPSIGTFHSFLLADSRGLPVGRLLEPEGIYNFSAGGDSYTDMHRKLLHLLEATRVDRIILTADDHTLSTYRVMLSNEDRSYQFLGFHDYARAENDGFVGYVKNVLMPRYIVFSNAKSRDLLTTSVRGRIRRTGQASAPPQDWQDIQDKSQLVQARIAVQFPDNQRSSALTQRLGEIIRLCRAHRIELIGLKFPLANAYLNVLGDRTFGADEVLMVNGIRILDFKKAFTEDDSLFANEDHLNERGGEALRRLIANRLGDSNIAPR